MDIPMDYHVWGAMLDAGTLKTHTKAGQHQAELQVHSVDDTK